MGTTATRQVRETSANPAAFSTSERHLPPGIASDKKAVGYGLPCSRCHAYYPADMPACPICQSPERVSPNELGPPPAPAAETQATAAATAGAAPLDEERERLLKELKTQAFAAHTQINTATSFHCALKHQHSGATEPAAVCESCYSQVRRQADLMEAALHIDAKDAAKIVYDAVWADTSDPNATYLNAAKALLAELHQRAGIGPLLGEHKSLSH